ncbi:hypothetical protein ACFQ44_03505 [Levilactobacillus lanxiensis]|uniref:Uncharacterized protein n=1 Tax=Levilactobacillus lanxiensis TaxID=2799568 RepID=A0ABW4D206_9LACO|nr:hypothetical protein [Levilactobacillus lanxiensis]
MNLKHVISSLLTAVILLAVFSGMSWYAMGKRTTTHQSSSPVGVISTPQTRAFSVSVK